MTSNPTLSAALLAAPPPLRLDFLSLARGRGRGEEEEEEEEREKEREQERGRCGKRGGIEGEGECEEGEREKRPERGGRGNEARGRRIHLPPSVCRCVVVKRLRL